MVGRSPWTAADAPVGLLAPCKLLIPLFRLRDEGVPRGPGGPPHNFRSIPILGKTSGIKVVNLPHKGTCHLDRVTSSFALAA